MSQQSPSIINFFLSRKETAPQPVKPVTQKLHVHPPEKGVDLMMRVQNEINERKRLIHAKCALSDTLRREAVDLAKGGQKTLATRKAGEIKSLTAEIQEQEQLVARLQAQLRELDRVKMATTTHKLMMEAEKEKKSMISDVDLLEVEDTVTDATETRNNTDYIMDYLTGNNERDEELEETENADFLAQIIAESQPVVSNNSNNSNGTKVNLSRPINTLLDDMLSFK